MTPQTARALRPLVRLVSNVLFFAAGGIGVSAYVTGQWVWWVVAASSLALGLFLLLWEVNLRDIERQGV